MEGKSLLADCMTQEGSGSDLGSDLDSDLDWGNDVQRALSSGRSLSRCSDPCRSTSATPTSAATCWPGATPRGPRRRPPSSSRPAAHSLRSCGGCT